MVVIPEWHARAACREANPDLFFPLGYGDRNSRAALAFCEVCAVRETCLEESLTDWQEYGIFGGMTPAQRRAHAGYTGWVKRPSHRRPKEHGSHGGVTRHRRAGEPLCDKCRAFIVPIKAEEKQRRKARKALAQVAS